MYHGMWPCVPEVTNVSHFWTILPIVLQSAKRTNVSRNLTICARSDECITLLDNFANRKVRPAVRRRSPVVPGRPGPVPSRPVPSRCICACICARAHAYVHAYVHAHVHVRMHMCMHMCTCACICACICARPVPPRPAPFPSRGKTDECITEFDHFCNKWRMYHTFGPFWEPQGSATHFLLMYHGIWWFLQSAKRTSVSRNLNFLARNDECITEFQLFGPHFLPL